MSVRKPPLAIRTKPLPRREECPSPSSQSTARARPSAAEHGLLVSETTAYYLVKCGDKWTSVAKGALFAEDGIAVPRSMPFAGLKGRRVRLVGKPAQAFFEDCEDECASTEPDESTESLASLTRILFSDIAAIKNYCKAPNADPRRIDQFLQERSRHYRKHSADTLTQLRTQTSTSALRARKDIAQALGNFPSAEEKQLLCDMCRTAAFSILLSCGHRTCRRCAEMLVRCPNCKTTFSSTDRKLLHFDCYKRSNSVSRLGR